MLFRMGSSAKDLSEIRFVGSEEGQSYTRSLSGFENIIYGQMRVKNKFTDTFLIYTNGEEYIIVTQDKRFLNRSSIEKHYYFLVKKENLGKLFEDTMILATYDREGNASYELCEDFIYRTIDSDRVRYKEFYYTQLIESDFKCEIAGEIFSFKKVVRNYPIKTIYGDCLACVLKTEYGDKERALILQSDTIYEKIKIRYCDRRTSNLRDIENQAFLKFTHLESVQDSIFSTRLERFGVTNFGDFIMDGERVLDNDRKFIFDNGKLYSKNLMFAIKDVTINSITLHICKNKVDKFLLLLYLGYDINILKGQKIKDDKTIWNFDFMLCGGEKVD